MSRLSSFAVTLDGDDIALKRQEIKNYFHNTFDLFEKVFELLKDDEVFYKKSEPTRHPMIFYFGHTATFFINKLVLMKIISKRINPHFESIFAVGVDEMSWDDMDNNHYQWPRVDEVRTYRDEVRKLVNNLIETLEFSLPITQESPMWIILMGIEHERIHIETSLVLHRQLPIEDVVDVAVFNLCDHSGDAPQNELVTMDGMDVVLGKEKNHHLYGWDNEYGNYQEDVKTFEVSKYLVSNAEFLAFVEAGGYEKKEYWDEEGWEFVTRKGVRHPHFWVQTPNGYRYRALSQIIPMPWNWPVDVNALEAEAFCRYKSAQDGVVYQLPSEAEYRVMYHHAKLEDIPQLHESRANINFYHYASSCPVDEFGFHGLYDVIGNVWQWSRTPIRGFDGFEVHPAYDDFSIPTFDEKHALILGASWASSGNLIMKHSRYAFRKHFFQNAGFRYVVSENKESKEDIYESDALISQYCNFQYGKQHFGVENFAVACCKIAMQYVRGDTKALDLGCATGRLSFELAHHFKQVEGIDFSARFIQVGTKLKEDGYIAYKIKLEGDITQNNKVTLEELGYENIKERVSFWQGDACNLKPHFQGYDLIIATNLLDRVYNPRIFLEEVSKRVVSGGIFILTSPYTWQESSTDKALWLGGYYDEKGEAVYSFDTLQKILSKEFDLLEMQDVEFVIQETQRKFQHTVSQLSVWRKKDV